MVLMLAWLLAGTGLPGGGVAAAATQTIEPATAQTPNLDLAIAAQRKLVGEQTRSAARASALNDLANLLELRGDVEGAFEHYLAAIAEDAAWAPAHYNLALLAYTTGDNELASVHLEAAVELAPGNAWAHYQLGRIADDAGDATGAVSHYVHALSLDSRLAFTDVNPHFAVNRHATEVLLRADRSRVEVLPPRAYAQPGRISALLLPRMQQTVAVDGADVAARAEAAEVLPEPDAGLPAAASPDRETGGASADGAKPAISLPDGVQTGDRATADEVLGRDAGAGSARATRTIPAVDRAAEASDPSAANASAAALEPARSESGRPAERPRVFTREHLRTRTLGSAGRVAAETPSGAGSPRARPGGGAGGGVQPGTPIGPRGRQPVPPATGTFGGGSSGRFQPGVRSSAQLETTIRRRAEPAP